MCPENSKIFMKEIENDTNGKIFHIHGLEKLILLTYVHAT